VSLSERSSQTGISATLNKIAPSSVAAYLTLKEAKIFASAAHVNELLQYATAKGPSKERTPNISAMIDFFNKVRDIHCDGDVMIDPLIDLDIILTLLIDFSVDSRPNSCCF
jgi:hypothetical protein